MKSNIELSPQKLNGQFYTPEYIINNMLDLSSYYGQKILNKHVIDNSCGNGAFLIAIVKRYCNEFLKNNSDMLTLSEELSKFIHGIEIDKSECCKCIDNLNNTIKSYGLNNINWDIICADSLTINIYNAKMDYVIGNPPYIRVHNLGNSYEKIKNFEFVQNGMTDLYIVFYEIGLKMLNDSGILSYITPSSFFNSIAGKYMRAYLVKNNLIDKIVDLKHFQAFTATTYTTISILKKNRIKKTVDYFQFDAKNNFPYYVDTLSADDFYIGGNFYFARKYRLVNLKEVLNFKIVKDHFTVKNGFATLADNFFIGHFDFNEFTIPVVKASTGKQYTCIFPYINGKLIPYQRLTENSKIKNYFETNKDLLLNRSIENCNNWYGFGRTQGIKDVVKCKYSINVLVKNTIDLKLIKCDKGVGVYGGLYILTEIEEKEIKDILYSQEFISYISLLGKYKSGGYYTFSSKDLKIYLEYKYMQRRSYKNE